MARAHLATYLNDHLAGSIAALELLEHVKSWYAGTEIEPFAAALYADIAEDRQMLQSFMEQLGVAKSTMRRMAGWFTEKLAQLKLKLDDTSAKGLRLLEAMEALSLGIEGKRLLCESLSAAAETDPALRVIDVDQLRQRSIEQRRIVESMRLDAARACLTTLE